MNTAAIRADHTFVNKLNPSIKFQHIATEHAEINNLIASRAVEIHAEFKQNSAHFFPLTQSLQAIKSSFVVKLTILECEIVVVIEKAFINFLFELGLGVPYSELTTELMPASLAWFSNFLTHSFAKNINKKTISVTAIEAYQTKLYDQITPIIFCCEMPHNRFYLSLIPTSPAVMLQFTRWLQGFSLKTPVIMKNEIPIKISINKGFTSLKREDLINLEIGDIILVDYYAEQNVYIMMPNSSIILAKIEAEKAVITSDVIFSNLINQNEHKSFRALLVNLSSPQALDDTPITVRFQIEERLVNAEEVEKYKPNYSLGLTQSHQTTIVHLCIMDKAFAVGELTQIKDRVAVQITQFIS